MQLQVQLGGLADLCYTPNYNQLHKDIWFWMRGEIQLTVLNVHFKYTKQIVWLCWSILVEKKKKKGQFWYDILSGLVNLAIYILLLSLTNVSQLDNKILDISFTQTVLELWIHHGSKLSDATLPVSAMGTLQLGDLSTVDYTHVHLLTWHQAFPWFEKKLHWTLLKVIFPVSGAASDNPELISESRGSNCRQDSWGNLSHWGGPLGQLVVDHRCTKQQHTYMHASS